MSGVCGGTLRSILVVTAVHIPPSLSPRAELWAPHRLKPRRFVVLDAGAGGSLAAAQRVTQAVTPWAMALERR